MIALRQRELTGCLLGIILADKAIRYEVKPKLIDQLVDLLSQAHS